MAELLKGVNFFAHQDRARGTTRKLVFLFVCAVATLIAITSVLVFMLLGFAEGNGGEIEFNAATLNSSIFLYVSLGVISVVILGALFRMAQLSGGGKVVAEAMGGRLLNTSTLDPDERKILNVVEEMAIASGTPVPPVYLLEDSAINAFAAGYKAQDAVIGITRGCIQQLNREELQGVIAHEFSHIFNGDMRLNIRLIGLLYGILVIGMIGYYILRGSMYRSHSYRSNRKGGGIAILGLGLVIVGYGGTFFGNIIKAAVSRQREFLADASAVQFTRNPDGIAGALKKIGGYNPGTHIKSHDASEISHMLFCQGIRAGFTGLFATHPPLAERISRIDPYWRGDFSDTSPSRTRQTHNGDQRSSGFSATDIPTSAAPSAIDSIGEPSSAHIILAAANLNALPNPVIEDAHDSFGACMLMYCVLLELANPETEKRQLGLLAQALGPRQFASVTSTRKNLSRVNRQMYLTLIDLCLPSLRQLSPVQYRTFMSTLSQLIVADADISVFEWCIFKILRYNLATHSWTGRAVDINNAVQSCEGLLSVLAQIGHGNEEHALQAFTQAATLLGIKKRLTFQPGFDSQTEVLERATDQLKNLKPLQKPKLLKAMVACINADGAVQSEEAELLRAVGALLDCPIPPLLDRQPFS